MDWQELRRQYPHSWLLVEAFDAYTEGDQRIIPRLELIAEFGVDWETAWDRYKTLHRADKHREYYVLHSDRETLDIGVLDAFWRVVP
jgi:hypothetical protein